MVRFVYDGDVITLSGFDPTCTVLEWLREQKHRTGTKEGCAEGDCGACTCVIGDLIDGQIRYRAVNTCIMFLPMLDGKELISVETIGCSENLHPVQGGMVEEHGSQCGFCTPGIIMSLFASYQNMPAGESENINDTLAGNLCRCTGYGPIIAAARSSVDDETVKTRFGTPETIAQLKALSTSEVLTGDYDDPVFEKRKTWFVPKTEEDLINLMQTHSDATLVAGATDVGLWVTKNYQCLETLIFLHQISSLKIINQEKGGLRIGAGVNYSDAQIAMAHIHPHLGELIRRIGSVQVRNSGTIGANIANGSPIGDTMPALIALNTQLQLMGPEGERYMPLEQFFIDYGKQDLRDGEFVRSILIPDLSINQSFATYKISKRFDQDISAVCGGFCFTLKGDSIANVRIAFGGMAATPKRAINCEASLLGQAWPLSEEILKQAQNELCADYQPITDMRASAEYRLKVAQNLLKKFIIDAPSLVCATNDGVV